MTLEQEYASQDLINFLNEFGQTAVWKYNKKIIDSQTGQYVDSFERKEIKVIMNNSRGNINQGEAIRFEEKEVDIGTIHNLQKDDEIAINGIDYIISNSLGIETMYSKQFTFKTVKARKKVE